MTINNFLTYDRITDILQKPNSMPTNLNNFLSPIQNSPFTLLFNH